MTQLFDEETRRRHARHRDRGGPVPGRRRAHAGRRRLRGRAARVGAGRRAQDLEGRARPPREERGRRRVPAPRRVPRPLRRARCRARTSRSRSSSRATRSRSPASRSARASRARSSGTSFHRGPVTHGSHNIRKPGSIGASATPSRVFKGMQDGRPHGRQARHPGRPDGARGRRRARTCCSSRAPSRARRTASSRSARRRRSGRAEGSAARPARRRRTSRSRRPSSAPRSSRTSCTRPCAPS